jgi:hypothetical protein
MVIYHCFILLNGEKRFYLKKIKLHENKPTLWKEIAANSCIPLIFILIAVGFNPFFFIEKKKHKEVEKKNLEIQYQREQIHAVISTQEEGWKDHKIYMTI